MPLLQCLNSLQSMTDEARYLSLDLLFPFFKVRALSKLVLSQQRLDVLNRVSRPSDATDLIPRPVGTARVTDAVPMIPVSVLQQQVDHNVRTGKGARKREEVTKSCRHTHTREGPETA